jgi:hypothetical protein
VAGGGSANGVNSAFLCAAPVSAGQMIVPSYVLTQKPPTSTSTVGGQLNVENAYWVLFTSPGLDYGTITYAEDYNLQVKYQ